MERSGKRPLDSGVGPPCARFRDPFRGTPLNRCGACAYLACRRASFQIARHAVKNCRKSRRFIPELRGMGKPAQSSDIGSRPLRLSRRRSADPGWVMSEANGIRGVAHDFVQSGEAAFRQRREQGSETHMCQKSSVSYSNWSHRKYMGHAPGGGSNDTILI